MKDIANKTLVEIWQAFIFCIKDILSKTGSQPAAISLGSAMHSLIPVNENCEPLYNMITWADIRSAEVAQTLQESAEGERIYKATGTPIHAMSPLCKIIYLKENEPDLFKKTVKFISIKEFIWYQLFHQFEIDYSIASATGLFNIQSLQWDTPTLVVAGINETHLSQPVNTEYKRTDVLEEKAALLGIDKEMPFIIGASDGCLANLGTLCILPNVAAVTIATSGAVRVATPKPVHNYEAMLFNYLLDKDTFISGGPINNGGITLKWFIESFLKKKLENDFEKVFNSIETVPAGCSGLIFLPYLLGERAPVWDSKSCGVFFGIKMQHTETYFLRAVVEGVCYALFDVMKMLEKESPIDVIRVSGGFTKSEIWIQLLATITGKKVQLLQTEDASASGAGFMALKVLNKISSYESLLSNEFEQVFLPDMEAHQLYLQYFSVYQQLYKNLKTSMHLLHQINTR